ncbi:hypothetical protein KVR01_007561 [Diaporthe batatas]|uniref:uncharacterized protein n=1 Tax=Diaporthe batatas TaxID=748121 RepID=UPI001D03B933|nr:uncharacterized protein KVR01_007561 [Diaporthe batatas]KAG8163083.1 hypothetical protein KVR01_007561 [Diaporthe batatas]
MVMITPSPFALSMTLPSAENGLSPATGQYLSMSEALAPPSWYIGHNPGVVSHGPMTPTRCYTDPRFNSVDSSAPYASSPPLPSIYYELDLRKFDDIICIVFGHLEASRSSQQLHGSKHKTTLVQALAPSLCSTTFTLGSRGLNYHVNPDNSVYRWHPNEIPIPSWTSSMPAMLARNFAM